MNDLVIWFITILSFLCGYYLGGQGKKEAVKIQQKIVDIIGDKPKPGVVRQLTDEEKAEKHSKIKQGNLQAFNKLAETLGWKK